MRGETQTFLGVSATFATERGPSRGEGQFVRPDVALARVEWTTPGDLQGKAGNLQPGPPRRGIFLWVVVNDAGSWRIRAVQNTERQ